MDANEIKYNTQVKSIKMFFLTTATAYSVIGSLSPSLAMEKDMVAIRDLQMEAFDELAKERPSVDVLKSILSRISEIKTFSKSATT